ncbi:MAG: hypothetical protein HYV60_13490 [Planctomycetia bacterium]|nr:hypothetical protein [Planctomycetia bacterium]
MNLTAEQILAIDKGDPVCIEVDGRQCVLLNSAAFDRMREQIDEWHPATMLRNMADLMADDWNDPAMRVYDE